MRVAEVAVYALVAALAAVALLAQAPAAVLVADSGLGSPVVALAVWGGFKFTRG